MGVLHDAPLDPGWEVGVVGAVITTSRPHRRRLRGLLLLDSSSTAAHSDDARFEVEGRWGIPAGMRRGRTTGGGN